MAKGYRNTITFESGSVGKLILCKIGNDLVLYGVMIPYEGIRHAEWRQFEKIASVSALVDFHFHKDIPHEGIILGGCTALFADGILLIRNKSTKFGAIHPEAVQHCVGNKIWVDYRPEGLGFPDGIPPLDDWLAEHAKKRRTATS